MTTETAQSHNRSAATPLTEAAPSFNAAPAQAAEAQRHQEAIAAAVLANHAAYVPISLYDGAYDSTLATGDATFHATILELIRSGAKAAVLAAHPVPFDPDRHLMDKAAAEEVERVQREIAEDKEALRQAESEMARCETQLANTPAPRMGVQIAHGVGFGLNAASVAYGVAVLMHEPIAMSIKGPYFFWLESSFRGFRAAAGMVDSSTSLMCLILGGAFASMVACIAFMGGRLSWLLLVADLCVAAALLASRWAMVPVTDMARAFAEPEALVSLVAKTSPFFLLELALLVIFHFVAHRYSATVRRFRDQTKVHATSQSLVSHARATIIRLQDRVEANQHELRSELKAIQERYQLTQNLQHVVLSAEAQAGLGYIHAIQTLQTQLLRGSPAEVGRATRDQAPS